MSENLSEKIEELEKRIDTLERENRYLHRLTSSKRFKFAEKIATSYNRIFPKSTKRRNMMEKIGRTGKKVLNSREARKDRAIVKKISKLADGYSKVIVLNSIPWGIKLKQRPHHLANEFSKLGFFVIYLEYDNPLKKIKVIKKNLITINSERFLNELPKDGRKCYFLSPNNMPTSFSTLKAIVNKGFGFIYDYLDEFHEDISGDLSIQMEVWDKIEQLKPVVCLATAKRLHDELKKKLGKNQKIVMASNAVNLEHFNFEKNKTNTPPIDLKGVVKSKKPIVGFYGALAAWIDYGLLNAIAEAHPDWNFVYLGVDYDGSAKELVKRRNVYNMGAKNYELLPKYAKYFDAAIIPFKRGEIAKATSPVKLFEYMAAGLPTVCTRDLQECAGYEYVYMSKDDAEFEKNLERAIVDHKDNEKRKILLKQAGENTWAKRAKRIADELN